MQLNALVFRILGSHPVFNVSIHVYPSLHKETTHMWESEGKLSFKVKLHVFLLHSIDLSCKLRKRWDFRMISIWLQFPSKDMISLILTQHVVSSSDSRQQTDYNRICICMSICMPFHIIISLEFIRIPTKVWITECANQITYIVRVEDSSNETLEFSLRIGALYQNNLSLLFTANFLIGVRLWTNKKQQLVQNLTFIRQFAVSSKESLLLIKCTNHKRKL